MSKFVCLLAITVIGLLAVKVNGESRIIGGENAVNGQFPHHVHILNIEQETFQCGGSIIGDRYVLTSIFCGMNVDDISNLRIVVGNVDREANATQHQVDKVTLHPEGPIFGNGIAVMRVEQPFEFTANVRAIRLPTADLPIDVDGLAMSTTIVGWGQNTEGDSGDSGNYPRILQWMNTTAISHPECRRLLNKIAPELEYILFENHLCTKDVDDVCVGVRDNGGGFITHQPEPELIAVLSWTQKCDPRFPLLSARVFPNLEFIRQAMQE